MRYAINGASTMSYSIQEDIRAAALTGISALELWWPKLEEYRSESGAEKLLKLLEDHGVRPIGICPFLVSPFRDSAINRREFEDALKLSSIIGCPLLTVCPDFRPINMAQENAHFALVGEFSWYASKAAEYGIKLAIEPIGRHSLIPGPQQALKLIEQVGSPENLGLLIDTFHYSCSGISEMEIAAIPLDRLFIVHVNDSVYKAADELKDSDRLYPGEGCLNLAMFMRALEEISYSGYFSIEVFRPAYWKESIETIYQKALKGLEYLSAI